MNNVDSAGVRSPSKRKKNKVIYYEDWIRGDIVNKNYDNDNGVRQQEPHSDFPSGDSYFWKASCLKCSTYYDSSVPPEWLCVKCSSPTWQPLTHRKSLFCPICECDLSPIGKGNILGILKKIGVPLSNVYKSHHCRRCGRLVCAQCIEGAEVDLKELGFQQPQSRVCSDCREVMDLMNQTAPKLNVPSESIPRDDAFITLRDTCKSFFPPKCEKCKRTYLSPPPQWKCITCRLLTWQLSKPPSCSVCMKGTAEINCHQCGYLVCRSCGAFKQPLTGRGWNPGYQVPVCSACFANQATTPKTCWSLECPKCHTKHNKVPKKWMSTCHQIPIWQPITSTSTQNCSVCYTKLGNAKSHCYMCGYLCCLACLPCARPMPHLGYDPAESLPMCLRCFDPETEGCTLEHRDFPYWIGYCPSCRRKFLQPPSKWLCPQCDVVVWQKKENVASRVCWVCKNEPQGRIVNCHSCGRIVCEKPCGSKSAEVPEREFTAGIQYSICLSCSKEKQSCTTKS